MRSTRVPLKMLNKVNLQTWNNAIGFQWISLSSALRRHLEPLFRIVGVDTSRLCVCHILLIAGVMCTGINAFADQDRTSGRCIGIDSQNHCTYLDKLSESVLLAGTIDSCSPKESRNSDGSKEDPESSVIFQFELNRPTNVALEMHGLGSALMLKQDVTVFHADQYVDSVNVQLASGRYTLVGRAAACPKDEADWSGVYKIRVDLGSTETAREMESVVATQEVMAPTRSEQRGKFSVARWLMVGMLSFVVFLLLIIGLT